ncbi:MAG: hypothetical protein JXA73_24675 [Acidobacteria bacterium]|nr:hypothetical protein [Acidobacteriota bacterium]
MRLYLVLIHCLLCPALFAQQPAQTSSSTMASPYVDREEKEFNFFPGGKAEISIGVPGSLKIVGWKKGSVRVEAERIIYYETEEKAKAFLTKSPLRVRHSQTSVTIQTTKIPDPPAILEINLTVYVPGEKMDIKAKMDTGDLSIEGINGWVEATVKEGSLEARSMAGYFSGITQRGDIFVEMSNIRWNGLEFGALTQLGSITLVLPKEYSAALQLEARSGKITLDYPPRVFEGEEVLPDIIVNKASQTLRAAVGDGGAPIRLTTGSGDVTLSLKKE